MIVPTRCALYRHYDEFDVLLYVGITESLEARTASHARRSDWVRFAARAEATWYNSRTAAADAELEAISLERPVFNVVGQDSGDDIKDRQIRYLQARDTEWGARARSFTRAVSDFLKIVPKEIKQGAADAVMDELLEEHGRSAEFLETDTGNIDYYSRLLRYMTNSRQAVDPKDESPLPSEVRCSACIKVISEGGGHYVMKDLSVLCTWCYERDGDHSDRLKFFTTDRRVVAYEIEAPF